MIIDYEIDKIDKEIQKIKKSAARIEKFGSDIEAVKKNLVRLRACTKMLELNISDIKLLNDL
jgi:hypothetical protein